MNISSRDNATPVFLLRNCAGHLFGSLRTLGAVAVGQLGKSSALCFGEEGSCILDLSVGGDKMDCSETVL